MSASVLAAPGEVIAGIERGLRDMWKTVPGELPKARACTMNLVVVAGSSSLAERYTQVVDDVTRGIPARAIVVGLDPDAKADGLAGEVTAVCAVGENAAICSERISLVASGSVCARIASAVDALRVPEIPTTLVWLGRVHVDDPVFLSLAEDAQRIVLDTEYTSLSSLLHLAQWARAEPGRPSVADLAWTRISVWQEMCARFFDGPTMTEHAEHVTRLEIRQASEPGARLGSEAALLLGWLATRLRWKPWRVGGTLRFRRPDGGAVAVSMVATPRPSGVAPSALAGVAIATEHAGIEAHGTLERQFSSGPIDDEPETDVLAWRLEVDVPSPTEQRVRLRANKGARLLERTLHRSPSDPALDEAVVFAEELAENDDLVCR